MSDLVGCKCSDWAPGIAKINAPIVLAQARNPHLTHSPAFQFVRFRFCPWCGERLRSVSPSEEQPPNV